MTVALELQQSEQESRFLHFLPLFRNNTLLFLVGNFTIHLRNLVFVYRSPGGFYKRQRLTIEYL